MEAPLAESEHEPFKSTSFNDLLEIEDGHFWFEERNKLIGWAIRKFFPAAKTFLEIGCGTAFVLRDVVRRFPEMRCSAIEYFDEGVEAARRRLPDVPIETGDARALDDKWAGTDLVGSFDVLEHIPEDEAVLREIHRVLKPG
ncbi:MAG: class I SAM-dependent methyltransferase, partial [Verrucomicrobiae bacterium]|nr:class I SAM-dependent methyltransferase [Verrucomicrobiae bacterium]